MQDEMRRRFWPLGRSRGDHEDRALSPRTTTGNGLIPFGVPAEPARSVTSTMTPENAVGIADVFACVRVLADAAASVPLIPYRRRGDDRRERAGGALAALLRAPAPGTTQASLIAQIVAHLNLYGNAYIGKYRGDRGVEQLGLLHPDRMAVDLQAGRPVYKWTDENGAQVPLGTEDVCHVRAPLSIDGLTGLSPIRQCRVALGLAGNLAEHADAFFTEGGRPDGIVQIPNSAPDAADRLREQWRNKRGGASRGRGIAVVTGEIKFQELSGPLDDMQFVEQRQLSTAEVARIFRVPPWMVGASSGDSMTYSNTEQQGAAFVTFSLRPWLVCIEQAITADSDLCRGSVYVEFLLDALLRADHKTRAEVYALALDPERGWMNRQEVRRLENLEEEAA